MSTQQRIAGRALDAEVAERVFGARWYPTPNDMNYREAFWLQFPSKDFADMGAGWVLGYRYADDVTPDVIKSKLPHYSEDIAAAFQVVEAMRAEGWHFEMTDRRAYPVDFFWSVRFWRDGAKRGTPIEQSESLAYAICLASLAAIEAATSEKAQLNESVSRSLPDTPRE